MGGVHASTLVNSCHQKTVWKSENIRYTWRVSPNEHVISECLLCVLVTAKAKPPGYPSVSSLPPTLPLNPTCTEIWGGLGVYSGSSNSWIYTPVLKGSVFRENSQKGSRPRVQNLFQNLLVFFQRSSRFFLVWRILIVDVCVSQACLMEPGIVGG